MIGGRPHPSEDPVEVWGRADFKVCVWGGGGGGGGSSNFAAVTVWSWGC